MNQSEIIAFMQYLSILKHLKIGKADLDRTDKDGIPLRIKTQIKLFRTIFSMSFVNYEIVFILLKSTTQQALNKEKEKLQEHYDITGEIPLFNKDSFKPKQK